MAKKIKQIAIIGGGASGLAAIYGIVQGYLQQQQQVQQLAQNSQVIDIINKFFKNNKITLFEADKKFGKSILRSGNGRCNFSNIHINKEQGSLYNHQEFVNHVFHAADKIKYVNWSQNFQKSDNLKKINKTTEDPCNNNSVIQMFDNLGLMYKVESEGRMYPYSNKATSVLDVLKLFIGDKIDIKVNTPVQSIKKTNNKYQINYQIFDNDKETIAKFDKVIVACGAKNNKIQLNNCKKMKFIKNKKILGPIYTDNKNIKKLDGIRVKANVSLYNQEQKENPTTPIFKQYGEILFRKYGLSGIVIFNLSRFVDKNKKQYVSIDFVPEIETKQLQQQLINKADFYMKQLDKTSYKTNQKVYVKDLLAGIILSQISDCVAKNALNKTYIGKIDEVKTIAKEIKNYKLEVKDVAETKNCQITRGGLSVTDVNPNTMECKSNKNLFFCGEILDVDGPCGGYNLHWAWVSGILAGLNLSLLS